MGQLRITVAECNYKELDRQLKEQFIHGLDDNDMLTNDMCAHYHKRHKYSNQGVSTGMGQAS